MADETLGGVQIPITADFSDLGPEMDRAVSEARSKADAIASAINDALGKIETQGFVSAFNSFVEGAGLSADAAEKLQARIEELWTGGQAADMAQAFAMALKEIGDNAQASVAGLDALAQAQQQAGAAASLAAGGLKSLSDGAQALVDAQKQADNELQQAKGILQEMQAAYQQGAISAEALARAEQDVASAFQAANPSLEQSKQAAKDASESFGSMNQALGLIGVSLSVGGFVALAKDIADVTDNLTKAQIALTAITGSAEEAAGMLEKIDQLGLSDGLSIPGLQQAAISMANLLPAGTDIVGVLSQLADQSIVSGKSVDSLANTLDRVVNSTSISAKQLASLGTNFDQLGEALTNAGVNLDAFGGNAKKAFESLDAHDKLVILQTDFENFAGIAEKVANETFGGAWHQAVAQFDVDVALIIKDLGSVSDKAGGLGDAFKSTVNVISSAFVGIYTLVKANVDGIVDLVIAMVTAVSGGLKAVGQAALGEFGASWNTLKETISTTGTLVSKSWSDIKADFASGTKTITDLMSQGTAAVKVHVDALDGLGKHAKDAADKVADAMKAVQAFDAQVSSGTGGIDALQRAFENASKSIDLVAKNDLPAAIKAVDDYTAAQLRNGASGEVIMQAFQKESQLISQLAKIDLPAASDAWTKLIGELSQGGAPLGIIQKALEDEEKVLQELAKTDLAAAEAGWDRLIQKLKDTNAPLSVLNQALQDHTKFLDAVSKSADAAVASQIKLAEQFSKIALNLPSANQAITTMDGLIKQLGPDMDLVVQKADPLNQAMIDFGINSGKAKTAVENLSTPIEKLTTDLGNLLTKAQASGDWGPVLQALDDFDKRIQTISKTDLPEAVSEMEAWIGELQKHNAPAELVQGQLEKLRAVLENMSKQGLPGAVEGWKQYYEMLKQVGPAIDDVIGKQERLVKADADRVESLGKQKDAYGALLSAQAQYAQDAIKLSEQQGKYAGDQILALEKIKLKQEDLKYETHGLADEYVSMIGDVLKGFDQMSQAMAGAIVDGKNMGDALIGVFKNIAKSLLDDVIKGALAPFEKELRHQIENTLPDFKKSTEDAVGGMKDLENSSKEAGDAMGGLKSSASAAATAVSQLAGTINLITGIIQAGAAVAADILLGHISSDTGHIEVNTREAEAELRNVRADLWSQFGQMYGRLGEVMNAAYAIGDTLKQMLAAGSGGGIPQQAVSDLDNIAADTHLLLSMFDSRMTTMLGALGTIASDIVTWGQNIESDASVMVGKLGQILTAMMTGQGSLDKVAADSSQIAADTAQTADSTDQMAGAMGDLATSSDLSSAAADITSAVGDGADQASSATTDSMAAASTEITAAVGASAKDITSAVGDVATATMALQDSVNAVSTAVAAASTSASTAAAGNQAKVDAANAAIQHALDDIADATAKGDLQALQGANAELDVAKSQLAATVDTTNAVIAGARSDAAWIQQNINASLGAAQAASNTTEELKQLRNAYDSYEVLMKNAIEDASNAQSAVEAKGFLDTAEEYRIQANNVMAQIVQVQGDISGAASLINQGIVAETGKLGFQVSGAGTLAAAGAVAAGNQVTAAVNSAAVAIASAVSAASFKPTGGGTTTSTTAAPPYAGPNPAAGSTPAPAGGGGFSPGGQKNDTNSPANIPTTIVAGTYNQYDPTIPDPTKPKPPAAPVLDTTSPYSSYTPPAATVPAPKPQPVGTSGTPLPTDGGTPPMSVTGGQPPSQQPTTDIPTLKGGPVHGPNIDIPLAAAPPTAIPTSPIIGGNFPGVGQAGEGGATPGNTKPIPVTVVTTGGVQPPPVATGGTPTTGSTGISTASGQQVDSQTLGFYAGALAELEDIRVQAHRIGDVDTSFRDGLVAIGKQLLIMTTKPGESATASFDDGGPVPFDMVAKVHQGEEVLPKDVAGMLRSMMRTPSYGAPKSPSYEDAKRSGNIVQITAPITVIARGDPRQQAEQFVTHLKKMVPDAGAFSS